MYIISRNTSSIVLPLIGLKNLLGHCNSTTTTEHYSLLCKSSPFRQRKALPFLASQLTLTNHNNTFSKSGNRKALTNRRFKLSRKFCQNIFCLKIFCQKYICIKLSKYKVVILIIPCFSYMNSWPENYHAVTIIREGHPEQVVHW